MVRAKLLYSSRISPSKASAVLGKAHSETNPAVAGVSASMKSVIGAPHVFACPFGRKSASSRAVGEYLRVSRMREPAESGLASNQAFLGRRFFIFDRIASARLNCR